MRHFALSLTSDIPTIVSGQMKMVGILDPQEEVWEGESGMCYPFSEVGKFKDTVAPYQRICNFLKPFHGTLFRFPLRTKTSKLSNKCHNILSLQKLLDALRKEADCLLLFLRSVTKVEIIELPTVEKVQFHISIACNDDKEHNNFIKSVTTVLDNQRMQAQPLVKRLARECSVEITAAHGTSQYKWFVVEQVGSEDHEVLGVANQLHLLPWVGVAFKKDAASLGGRVFCCLPMPDEISSPLPVHVNGTFGLSDDRRTLKWKSKERQNDTVSQWNEMIINRLLPSCYAHLICVCTHNCHLLATDVYKAWPDVAVVERNINWSPFLEPFFNCLLNENVLWIDNVSPGCWTNVADAVVVPSTEQTSALSTIKKVMFNCGVNIVQVPNNVLTGLQYSRCVMKILSPDLVRQMLKNNPLSYTDVDRDGKLNLLSYCISDRSYARIVGIFLLPLLSGTFVSFTDELCTENKVFLCTKDYPSLLFQSLNAVHHILVDDRYETELYELAKSGGTQLSLLDDEQVATLLRQCLPASPFLHLTENCLPPGWLKLFWEWSLSHNLGAFVGLFLVPLSHPAGHISRLVSLEKSAVMLVECDDDNEELLSSIKKLPLSVALFEDYPYLSHKSIFQFMHKLSATGLLKALSNVDRNGLKCAQLSRNNACAIQRLLANIGKITPSHLEVVVELPILITIRSSVFSVEQARCNSWRGQIIVLPDEVACTISPPRLFVLSKNLNQIQFLKLLMAHNCVQIPSTSELIAHTLLPMIADKTTLKEECVIMMKQILDLVTNIDEYSEDISKLSFIQVDATSELRSPRDLYYPSEKLCSLFYKQPVFPLSPFDQQPYITKLSRCGLKCTITSTEIMKIIDGIKAPKSSSPQLVDIIRMTRSCAVLKHICTKLEDYWHIFNNLTAHSFLPIQYLPPEDYPKCLLWKGGKYVSHFISLSDLVVLVTSNVIPLIAGSQVYMVRKECAFSPEKLEKLNCLSALNSKHVLAHFREVIDHYKEIPNDSLLNIINHTYKFLTEHCCECDDLHTFSHPWIWVGNKFVHPQMVAMKQNHRFRYHFDPYHYIIPNELHKYEKLFLRHGVPSETTDQQLVAVIAAIKEKCELEESEALDMIICILNHLTKHGERELHLSGAIIYVPIESQSLMLENSKDVVYSDNYCLRNFMATSRSETGTKYKFVHNRISTTLAKCLHIAPLSARISGKECIFRNISQHEPLTVRLKNIVSDYKGGLTIIKELLQNADDAGATVVNICYDGRTHNIDPKQLIFPGMASSHGPALVVHNNAQFREIDFDNILKLGGATKIDEPLKIGKFGLGFCSIYHITDVPSFVSGNSFVVLDPTGKHLSSSESDSAQPRGQIISLEHPIFEVSKQLDPYIGLYEFDPRKKYDGTVFRFPFRVARSEICENVCTEMSVTKLKDDIKTAGSKLLLFLQNVVKITFSEIRSENPVPSMIIELEKTAQTCNTSDGSKHYTIRKTLCKHVTQDDWLVSTSSANLAHQGAQKKYATASVACLLQYGPDKTYSVQVMDGESFCYLPLSCQTGLPVHVNSNFAVLNNRRGIWTTYDIKSSQGESESQWNIELMKTVIPQAYTFLLKALKALFGSKILDYNFYTLWPLTRNLKQQNPWSLCIKSVYESIDSCELLYSTFALQWFNIRNCQLLSPFILCLHNGNVSTDGVEEVCRQLKLPVVNLPEPYCAEINISSFTEEMFAQTFFFTITSISLGCKVTVLERMFKMHSVSKSDETRWLALKKYLVSNPSVPCITHGKVLRKCTEVVDPKAYFAKLFNPEEERFPLPVFCTNDIINCALKELGMVSHHLPWSMLEERAMQIPMLFKKDKHEALKRVEIIVQSAYNNIKDGMELDAAIDRKLRSIAIFPTMQRPAEFPLQWYGTEELRCGSELVISAGKSSINFCLVAGSQVCIVSSDVLHSIGHGHLENKLCGIFGIRNKPSTSEVLNQLKLLIKLFLPQSLTVTKRSVKNETISMICFETYRFFEECVSIYEMKSKLQELQTLPCIWSGASFVYPMCIADQWSLDGPYLHRVPESLRAAPKLKMFLNIKKQFSTQDIIEAMQKLSHSYGMVPVDETCHEFLRLVISELIKAETLPLVDVMMPSDNFIMYKAKELYYLDDECWPIDESCLMINRKWVPNELARRLGVKPVRNRKLEMNSSKFGASPFGQKEKLTQRIKNILREYPFDITVLKELLQNADDAKATKMFIILDCRYHKEGKVLSDEWKKLQGPALLVWNDSAFSEKDIKGIQDLGFGSKRSDTEAIGQYGIGFNVVYHLTDCPSFITNNSLYVFDPHCKYIPQATPLNPGRKYDLTGEFLEYFEDLRSPYLYTDLNSNNNFHSGVLFRFPLRHSLQLVNESEIMGFHNRLHDQKPEPVSISTMMTMIHSWAPKIKQALYFLQNIAEIKFLVIDSKQPYLLRTLYHYKCNLGVSAIEKRKRVHSASSMFNNSNKKPCVVLYPLEVVELDASGREMHKEQWAVQQGVGDMLNESHDWEFCDIIKPRHGIAAPLNKLTTCDGQVFCFLPLPIKSGLPVHINGQFILDSSRRALWTPTNPGHQDDRTRWNERMLKSISSSYANLIATMTSFFEEGNRNIHAIKTRVEEYYCLFPTWRRELLIEFSTSIAKDVYRNLTFLNSPVLCSLVATGSVINTHWHPIRGDKVCDQIYFDNDTSDALVKLFEKLGMNITCAPLYIRDHFKDVETEIPIISPHTVFAHYRQYAIKLPCPIESTAFHTVSFFKVFSQYLLQCDRFSITLQFPESPMGYPFLVTADGQLCRFDGNNKVLVSKYSHLFQHHLHMFLHPELIDLNYSTDYFLAPKECNLECIYTLMDSILNQGPLFMVHQLPLANSCITYETLVSLWNCLSHDPVFKLKIDFITKNWAILLTTDKRLFSHSDDHVVPVVADKTLNSDGTTSILFPKAVKILMKLGIPILDTTVVEVDSSPCPHTSDQSKVLKLLYHLHNADDISSKLCEMGVDALLDYFQNINFHNNKGDLNWLLQLPLCMDVTGSFRVPTKCDVYIWPNQFPNAFISKWLNASNALFISQSWKWTKFFSLVLHINEISSEDVYTKFIFKQFPHLSEAERLTHLQYIRDNIYPSSKSFEFKHSLKQLPCISDNGNLRCVTEFCDPRQKIFSFFGTQFRTLPSCFHSEKWLEFLSLLGLRRAPTKEEFLCLCSLVAIGNVPDISQVSNQLLECLFEEETLQEDSELLSKISTIPFVCTHPVPSVSWILDACQTHSIQQGGRNISMTQLMGSAAKQHEGLLWTLKPVVQIPKIRIHVLGHKTLRALKIITSPMVSDVIENIRNISTSRFSNTMLFENYPSSYQTPQECKSVIDVMIENFKYLKKHNGFEHCECLSKLPCIPVHVNPNQLSFNGFVLVRPEQVMLDEGASEFHPYLHALPDKLSELTQHLYTLGVAKVLGLTHIRLALELISKHEQCIESCMLVNTIGIVQRLVVKLYKLLTQSDKVSVEALRPLYLPSSSGRLFESSQLFYCDREMYGKLQVMGKQVTFIKLPEACSFTDTELIKLLPREIRPKPLSEYCIEKLHGQSIIIHESVMAKKLYNKLTSATFRAAVCAIVSHETNDETCSQLDDLIKHFQHTVTVNEVNPLKVQLLLKSNANDEIASINMSTFIETCGGSCNIYVKASMSSYEHHNMYMEIGKRMAEVIHSSLAYMKMNFGCLSEKIAILMMTENIEEIRDYLRKLHIKLDGITLEQDKDFTPTLGARVPQIWLQYLDHSIGNFFRPEEWVAYEVEEDVTIFARILCPILHGVEESNQLPKIYIIWISDEDTKEVSCVDLYKICFATSTQQPECIGEVLSDAQEYNGHACKKPRLDPTECAKNELLNQLNECWKFSKEEQEKAMRRLQFKWHPDKNPDQVEFAEEIFKFLMQCIELHKRQDENAASDEQGSTSSSNQSSSSFSTSSHYHSTWTSGGHSSQFRSGHTYGWMSPSANSMEAKRWLSQAEGDFEALMILYKQVMSQPDICCNVCFMAHEVAEKALKAGRYATSGMSSDSLKHHQLINHARAIMFEKPEITQGLEQLVHPLESYYLDTRFPNKHQGNIVPKNVYNAQQATDAQERASKILHIIQKIM